MRPKRSIIWDEIGSRLGKGKRSGRTPILTPPGVSQETKRVALERAKHLVAHRHFAEVKSLVHDEIEFLVQLDDWWLTKHPHTKKPSESGVEQLIKITGMYYEAMGFTAREGPRDAVVESDGSVMEPMLTRSGVKRPRPRAS